MLQLLRADFYKLSKMKSFFICLLILLALIVGSVFLSDYTNNQNKGQTTVDENGQTVSLYDDSLSASSMLTSTFSIDTVLFASIVISLLCANEFGFGTIKNTAARGFRRSQIYCSKLLVSMTVLLCMGLVGGIGMTVTATALWGFGDVGADYWVNLLQTMGLQILLCFAFTAVFATISVLARSSGGAIALNICVLQFSGLAVQLGQLLLNKVFHWEVNLRDYLLSTNLQALGYDELTGELATRSLVVGVVFLVVAIAVGLFSFQKRDIK